MNRVGTKQKSNVGKSSSSSKSALKEVDTSKKFWFGEIDTIHKAYLLGFMVASGKIVKGDYVRFVLDPEAKEFIKYIYKIFKNNTNDQIVDATKEKHPKIQITKPIGHVKKYINTNGLKGRNVPIIKKDLEVYMVRGIFDVCGTLMWGNRKDRNMIWQRVVIKSSESILQSLQSILTKKGISSAIRINNKEANTNILSIKNREDVLKFYNYIYADKVYMPVKHEFAKFNALRHELGGFSEEPQ